MSRLALVRLSRQIMESYAADTEADKLRPFTILPSELSFGGPHGPGRPSMSTAAGGGGDSSMRAAQQGAAAGALAVAVIVDGGGGGGGDPSAKKQRGSSRATASSVTDIEAVRECVAETRQRL